MFAGRLHIIFYTLDIYMQANIQESILSMLKQAYGSTAEFRDGQYEAIEATLTNKRTLVVQKTGWGKSLVYFYRRNIIAH